MNSSTHAGTQQNRVRVTIIGIGKKAERKHGKFKWPGMTTMDNIEEHLGPWINKKPTYPQASSA